MRMSYPILDTPAFLARTVYVYSTTLARTLRIVVYDFTGLRTRLYNSLAWDRVWFFFFLQHRQRLFVYYK